MEFRGRNPPDVPAKGERFDRRGFPGESPGEPLPRGAGSSWEGLRASNPAEHSPGEAGCSGVGSGSRAAASVDHGAPDLAVKAPSEGLGIAPGLIPRVKAMLPGLHSKARSKAPGS